MEYGDLGSSPALTRASTYKPDKTSINHQLALVANQLVAKFVGLDIEFGMKVTHHYRELAILHGEIHETLDQIDNIKSREKNLTEVLGVVTHRIDALFSKVLKDRQKLEALIEEAAQVVYSQENDKRFPRSTRLGLGVDREVVLRNIEEAKELIDLVSSHRQRIHKMAFVLDTLSETHRNLLVSHRTDNYEQDEIAWQSYQAAMEMINMFVA
ncbi:MAG: hypothetical protein KDK62_04930 [Chlamydiia bacterium]|nr:hypothetical protein [Chlamydiia bacterium]